QWSSDCLLPHLLPALSVRKSVFVSFAIFCNLKLEVRNCYHGPAGGRGGRSKRLLRLSSIHPCFQKRDPQRPEATPEMGPAISRQSNNNPISFNKLSVAPIIVAKVPSVQLEL